MDHVNSKDRHKKKKLTPSSLACGWSCMNFFVKTNNELSTRQFSGPNWPADNVSPAKTRHILQLIHDFNLYVMFISYMFLEIFCCILLTWTKINFTAKILQLFIWYLLWLTRYWRLKIIPHLFRCSQIRLKERMFEVINIWTR